MRQSTTTRRHFAGYIKRKGVKPKLPPSRTKRPPRRDATFIAPAPHVITLKKPSWMRVYGVPALLISALGLCVWLAVEFGDAIQRDPLAVSNSPRYSSLASRNTGETETSRAMADLAARRAPLPTDQSFVATPYRHATTEGTGPAAAPLAGVTNDGGARAAPGAGTAAADGTFHSTATGHCVIDTRKVENIASVVEGCLRRPN